MNKRSMRMLGFNKIKQQLMRETSSCLSRKLVNALFPVQQSQEVARLLTETEEAVTYRLREKNMVSLAIFDIYTVLDKAQREILLTPRECTDIWHNIGIYDDLRQHITDRETYPLLCQYIDDIADFSELIRTFTHIFDEDLQIRDTASSQLQQLRQRMRDLEGRTKRYIQEIVQDKDKQKYFQEALVTVRNARYVIPIKQEYRYAFPGIVHDTSASGATLYMEPLNMVDMNNELQTVRVREQKEIERIFQVLTHTIHMWAEDLHNATQATAQVDMIFAKAKLAERMHACRPKMAMHGRIHLIQARHPLVPAKQVVANTIILGDTYRMLLITGSNTGGKTVLMKTLGLLVCMHQAGLFIPVEADSELAVFHDVLVDIGDEQDLTQNLSTFSGHMTQLIYILKHCRVDDLVLIDELGSGTDPAEGSAIAIALLEALKQREPVVMVTTHYNELKNYAYQTTGIENGHVEFDERTLQPTYRLQIGAAGSSHAFSISERLGLPPDVLARAKEIRKQAGDMDMEQVLAKVNRQAKWLDEKERILKKRLQDVGNQAAQLYREKQQLQAQYQTVLEKAKAEAQERKRQLRVESEQIIRALKEARKQSLKEKTDEQIAGIRKRINDLAIPNLPVASDKRADLLNINVGDFVYLNSLHGVGQVTAIQGKQVTASIRGMTIRVKRSDISQADTQEIQAAQQREKKAATSEKTHSCIRPKTVATEINIIGETYVDALPRVERFLDQALVAGYSPVKIIHGKGSGALRRQIHSYLRDLPFVTSVVLDDGDNGGAGVTWVYFST